jgi:thiamine monophosphate synthase
MHTTHEQPTSDRADHFDRLQRALEEGLRAINAARSPEEAEKARQRARRRLEELNQDYDAAFTG